MTGATVRRSDIVYGLCAPETRRAVNDDDAARTIFFDRASGDRMDFVQLEVWADFQDRVVNPSASQWIVGDDGDGNEPWVFIVDTNGAVTYRFDNVANPSSSTPPSRR